MWEILKENELSFNEKYILGCTPLLIYNKIKIEIPKKIMNPLKKGIINPPSVLAHGLENHPRTAIGIKNNELYFIIIEQNELNEGCSLLELQQIGMDNQLDSLLNLDGGGSSQFRLINKDYIIKNNVSEENCDRILGHVLVIFDESIKLF